MSEDREREERKDKGSTEIINYENQGVCSFLANRAVRKG
jgi:hypothetical protein